MAKFRCKIEHTHQEVFKRIIPYYWAEGRVQQQHLGKQVTVRRFGWSNHSDADAQTMADQRAQQALERIISGEQLERREPKTAYNGADGVPIREEILSEHGDAVVTRNAYGARCLNTPNVFFADIDFESESLTSSSHTFSIFSAVWLGTMALAWVLGWLSWPVAVGLFMLALVITAFISSALTKRRQAAAATAPVVLSAPEQTTKLKVQAFLDTHPGWGFRLYRTPAGLRLMATHQTLLPHDPAVALALQALGADPVYTAMCLKQNCFRARLTAKPWRIGVHTHMRPSPGVWPVAPDRLQQRQVWVQAYEKAAASFAACRYVETLGHPTVHFEVAAVMALHDEQCQATSGLQIA